VLIIIRKSGEIIMKLVCINKNEYNRKYSISSYLLYGGNFSGFFHNSKNIRRISMKASLIEKKTKKRIFTILFYNNELL
jgi:hypothetical protein